MAIPDPGTAAPSITVGVGGFVKSLDVAVDVTHPFDADLKLEIVSPGGEAVTLAEAVGMWGHDFIGTVFKDGSPGSIASGSPPFKGTFRPIQALSRLAGLPAQGIWKLRVTDMRGGYAGRIER